jgi:thiol-disulfide isomerase/thioredoxin
MSARSYAVALLSAGALAALTGCEEKKDPATAPKARLEAVQATGPATPAPSAPLQAVSAAAPAHKRILCAQQLGKPPKDAPKNAISRAGESTLPEKLPVGGGHWTWINLWAAWCVPCKEEIPRLKQWEAKTAGERVPLRVVFVSMDDDARQLETFLGAQPPGGLRASYWLQDGPQREAWLKEAGIDGEPELPAHVLVDPNGKVRCHEQGAVEDADFVEVQKILRGQRGGAGAGLNGDGTNGNTSGAKKP